MYDHDGHVDTMSKKQAGRDFNVFTILPVITILAWALCFGFLMFSEHYYAFLHPKVWPLLLIGFLIAFTFLLYGIYRFVKKEYGYTDLQTVLRSAILCLPIFFILSVQGTSLDSFALSKRSLTASKSQTDAEKSLQKLIEITENFSKQYEKTFDPLNQKGNIIQASILDLNNHAQQLHGKRVAVAGSVLKGKPSMAETESNTFILFRFLIICCTADATPIEVHVQYEGDTELKNDDWVKVTGTFYVQEKNGYSRLHVKADSVVKHEKPPLKEKYFYFSL